MKLPVKSNTICIALSLLSTHHSVFAAAFSSEAYSVSGIANAYAGSVTGMHDNSDMFFNPAVLSQFGVMQLTVGTVYSNPNISTTVQSTTVNGIAQGGVPTASPGQASNLPNLSFSMPVSAKWSLGLNVSSPYNLKTDYPPDSLARYHALDTSVDSLNINPMLAYKLTDQTSVGLGVQHERLDVDLIRNIAPSGVLGRYRGNDSDYGFNLGVLSRLTPDLSVGMAYRSDIKHTLDGVVDLTLPSGTSLPSYQGKVNFTMPDMLTLGAAYQATDRVELAADLRWTGWSHISEFLIERVNPPPGNTNIAVLLPLRDSVLASFGLNYRFNDQWLLRSGLAYEKEAVTGDYTNPRFPEGNRTWLSLGAQYKVTQQARLNLSYTHQFMQDTTSHIPQGPFTAGLDASYRQSVNIIGAALTVAW